MNAKIAAAAGVIAVTISACATPPGALVPGKPLDVRGRPIAARQVHEECARLRAGDAIEYRFQASAPLDFNIHYHDGKVVVMPISREKVTADAATFRALTEQDYCLMWEAGAEATSIDYRVVLQTGPER